MRRNRRGLGLFVTLVLMAGGVGCSDDATTDEPVSQPDDSAAVTVADVTNALTASGVVIVADEAAAISAPTETSAILTVDEVERATAEMSGGDGTLGSDLDLAAALPADVPGVSYFIAAWISEAATPAALTAAAWMGDRDWQMAPAILFPLAVIDLFISDVGASLWAEAAEDGLSDGSSTSVDAVAGQPGPSRVASPLDNPCGAVSGFIAKTLDTVFGALRLSPAFLGDSDAARTVGGVIAGLWNGAVQFAKGAVSGLIDSLTAPIVAAIRFGLGALAAFTTIASYFKEYKLKVTTEPASGYRYAIGAEADLGGTFVAHQVDLSEQWPTALSKCAETLKVTLPEGISKTAIATWKQTASADDPPGVITITGPLQAKVSSDGNARLTFKTGRETDEDAKGDLTRSNGVVIVKIPRKEFTGLFDIAKTQLGIAQDLLLANIPGDLPGELRNQASAQITKLTSGVIDDVNAQVSTELGDSIFGLSGTGFVSVAHHAPHEDPPTRGGPAEWSFTSAAKYSGGTSTVTGTFTSCNAPVGPWMGTVHIHHTPATSPDPTLDVTLSTSWTFGADNRAEITIGPYGDTVYLTPHTLVYYPTVEIDAKASTITVIHMEATEDGPQRVDVTDALAIVGIPQPYVLNPLLTGCG